MQTNVSVVNIQIKVASHLMLHPPPMEWP